MRFCSLFYHIMEFSSYRTLSFSLLSPSSLRTMAFIASVGFTVTVILFFLSLIYTISPWTRSTTAIAGIRNSHPITKDIKTPAIKEAVYFVHLGIFHFSLLNSSMLHLFILISSSMIISILPYLSIPCFNF